MLKSEKAKKQRKKEERGTKKGAPGPLLLKIM